MKPMVVHALQILKHELDAFLKTFPPVDGEEKVMLGNIAQADTSPAGNDSELRTKVVITLVNLREEKTLKNQPSQRLNDTTQKFEYFNPSVFLNMYLLVSAGNSTYNLALTQLSRVILFFQGKTVFTHNNTVAVPTSIVKAEDRMDEFKMIVTLRSPSFEEVNHLWGTLGGKQVPFALYEVRIVEMKRFVKLDEVEPIQEVQSEARKKEVDDIIKKREELEKV